MKIPRLVLAASLLAGCALFSDSDAKEMWDVVDLPIGKTAMIPTNAYFLDAERYCVGQDGWFDCRLKLDGIRILASELRTDIQLGKMPLVEGIMLTHNYWLHVRVGEFQRDYKGVGH